MGDPISAVASIGMGMMAQQNAKKASRALDTSNAYNNEGFEMAKPFIQRMYDDGSAALDRILDTGVYQGSSYVGMTPEQDLAARSLTQFGQDLITGGQGFMNTARGFGQNYADMYNSAMMNDPLQTARDYALANSGPLIQAAMRDSERMLNEQTLPTINMAAASSGNTNSSRAGVAEALARRAYDDRMADTTADIQDKLMARSIAANQDQFRNQMSANDALQRLYGIGVAQVPTAAGMIQNAQNLGRVDAQAQLDDARRRFDEERDFEYNMLTDFNQGILSQAPRTPTPTTPNYFNPLTSGVMGGLQGFGMGKELQDLFGASSAPAVSPTVLTGFNGGFNPASLNSAFTGGMI